MRRVIAIAVIAEFCIVVLLLYNDIKTFIWTHPWWHSFLVAIPGIVAPMLAWFELQHSREANELRSEANNHRIRANTLEQEANGLRAEQARSLTKISEVQAENVELQAKNVKLQAERNEALSRIAANTQRVPTEAENNARILKNYLGQRAFVSKGGNNWGAMGAIIADVNDNNILTLFTPAGYSSSQAWGQAVRCDKLHIVEVPVRGMCRATQHH
jgi:hypothetical protein